jgi:hypothetical protein
MVAGGQGPKQDVQINKTSDERQGPRPCSAVAVQHFCSSEVMSLARMAPHILPGMHMEALKQSGGLGRHEKLCVCGCAKPQG